MTQTPSVIEQQTRAFGRGCRRSFAQWYDQWYDWSIQEIQGITGQDLAFCQDVVQDVMITVLRRMPPMANQAAQRAWLRRALVNRARDHLRRDLRRHRREQGRQAREKTAAQTTCGLDDLRSALRALDPATTCVLRWRFDFGWTLTRIGRELGWSTSTTEARVRAAVTRLRAELESMAPEKLR